MITLKEQEIYRILQTKDPAIATLEGYGIKKKVKMFVEKNPHYQNIDFTINDYDKQIYLEATRSMVRRLLLNGYSQQDIYRVNRQINKLAESFYKMPLHKILSENGVRQVRKLLETSYIWNGTKMVEKGSDKEKSGTSGSGGSSGTSGSGGSGVTETVGFLANMAQKVLNWAQKARLQKFSYDAITKLRNFITIIPKENDDPKKKLGKMVTGWIAIISSVVGAAFLAKWLIKLFLKAVKGGVNALKKFFGIFSAKTKIPLETPNE
jgi:hypothetical protein